MIRWRNASRTTYYAAVRTLRKALYDRLQAFFPSPNDFIAKLAESRAVLGGEFALSFILRDNSMPIDTLEIFAIDTHFQTLLDFFSYSPSTSMHLALETIALPSTQYSIQHEVSRFAVFHTHRRRTIYLFESTTMSPCSPVARYWTTALMNFVTAQSYGCAYPALTLRRRGLVSDMALETLTRRDISTMATLLQEGFTFGSDASRWPEFASLVDRPPPPGIAPCFRDLYVCPDQGRYFGDPGSLVDFIDPLNAGPGNAGVRLSPPFGHMVAWRLWCTAPCTCGCFRHDDILPEGTITMGLMFVDDHVFYASPPPPPARVASPAVTFVPQNVRGRRRAASI